MEGHNDMYFSIWYGVYNARTGEFDYCSGGHPPALLIHPDGGHESLSSGETVIGALSTSRYAGGRVRVEPGSRLYVFSDGAYEIGRPGAEMMTHEEFIGLIAATPGERRLSSILTKIREQHGGDDFEDDFSLLEFCFQDAAATAVRTIHLSNAMEELRRLLAFTQEFTSFHGISREDQIDLDVILEEMVTNVFKYGGLPQGSDACSVELTLRGKELGIRITDSGIPFNPLDHPEVDTAKGIEDRPIGGLGIHFVKNLTVSQAYEYRERKNILTLTKELRS